MSSDDRWAPAASDDDDDLLQPSLQHRTDSLADGRPKPWNVSSQFYVAFFGGVLALGAIAWLNGARLGMVPSRRRLVLLVCGASLVVVVALAVVVFGSRAGSDATRDVRLGSRVVAVVAHLACAWLQRPSERAYRLRHGDEAFASLWRPGLAAVFGLGAVQGLAVGALSVVL